MSIRSFSPVSGEKRKPSSKKEPRERALSRPFIEEEGAAAQSAGCTGGSGAVPCPDPVSPKLA
ncbi:MAG: hypothetical protein IKT57_08015 [Clostridia bacterium]|nr:hypothetical protein [Clostridia bacterium]